mmetsp:Transcript_5595/g.8255  ORF Transcript_5595/g.8255 Transcript_5595/m.8255 type:complete len:253 (-) Transcript_5595:526-1284(-)
MIARSLRTLACPNSSNSATNSEILFCVTVSCTVKDKFTSEVDIRSTLIPCLRASEKTWFIKLVFPTLLLEIILSIVIPFLEDIATTPVPGCLSLGSTIVPFDSGLNVFRIWTGTSSSIVHSMVYGWRTSFPKYVSSDASRGVTWYTSLAVSNFVGFPVKIPSLSFQTCKASAFTAAATSPEVKSEYPLPMPSRIPWFTCPINPVTIGTLSSTSRGLRVSASLAFANSLYPVSVASRQSKISLKFTYSAGMPS